MVVLASITKLGVGALPSCVPPLVLFYCSCLVGIMGGSSVPTPVGMINNMETMAMAILVTRWRKMIRHLGNVVKRFSGVGSVGIRTSVVTSVYIASICDPEATTETLFALLIKACLLPHVELVW